ncbi:MAG: S1/P1 nuclease, partial [Gammaproteobacteria bacterium]|nr:S1/P1 nuclease [Gammaproteobacteria bacterium]
TGIQRSLSYLSRPAEGKRDKIRQAAALRFIGHFIGDLHQPLHVSREIDKGGNFINVTFFGEQTNLHRIWDSHLPDKSGLKYPDSLEIISAQPFADTKIDIIGWANESWILAKNQAYLSAGTPIENKTLLGERYLAASKPIIYEQIIKAGNRLALVVNSISRGKPLRFIDLSPAR